MTDAPAVELNEDGSRILMHAGFRHKEQCKLVPGAKYDDRIKLWWTPTSWAACKQLRGVFGHELVVGPRLTEWSWQEYTSRVEPCTRMRMDLDAPGNPDLRTFQRGGVQWLLHAQHAILCDDMGTGKTVQLAALIELLRFLGWAPFPVLVVCPNSVKTVWRRELEKWVPGVSVAVLKGGAVAKRKLLEEGHDVVIVNYESAWRMSRLSGYGNIKLSDNEKKERELNAIPWRMVIADEAHKLKDPKAKQTRAVWRLAHQASVVWRFALTGTPLANAPDDLWAILHMVAPEEWPSRTSYVDRYCLFSWNPFGTMAVVGVRPETQDEFFSIVDPRMRRMPKDLVLPFLPPKVRATRWCEMSSKQAKAYAQMESEMYAELGGGDDQDGTIATLPIVQRLRLMQFSSSFAELEWTGEYMEDGRPKNRVRLAPPSSKVDDLLDWVDELPITEPFVVFAESRQLIEMAGRRLEEQGIVTRYIVGGMTEDQRYNATEDFQNGRARAILLTFKAGGEGITLTRANQIAFLQRSWSMLNNKQAEDRVHRIGSEEHRSITITDFVAPDTVEVQQIQTLVEKFDRLQEIVRDRETLHVAALAGDQNAAAKLAQLEAEEASINGADDFVAHGWSQFQANDHGDDDA